MKKLKLAAVLALLFFVTTVSAQMSLGIKGGVNMSNVYGDDVKGSDIKIGFHAGLAADYNFAPEMAIQTGLFLTTKGFEFNEEVLGFSADASANLMYLQVPVHFAYKIDVTPGTRVVLHGGPYAAYGIAGKTKGAFEGVSDETDSFGDNAFDRFDAGLGLGVGAEFGALLFDIGWDMGLIDILPDSKIKNQNAYLSVGYRFN